MLTVITLSYYLIITTPPRIFRYQLFTRLTPGEPLNQETPFLYIKHITHNTVHIIHSSLQHLLSQHLYFLAICRRLKLIKTPQLTSTKINSNSTNWDQDSIFQSQNQL